MLVSGLCDGIFTFDHCVEQNRITYIVLLYICQHSIYHKLSVSPWLSRTLAEVVPFGGGEGRELNARPRQIDLV